MTTTQDFRYDEDPPGVRVVVVEDEWSIAEELRNGLTAMGFEVPALCALSEEAIALCEQLRPDLVLMDICLSTEMDGTSAARVIGKRFDIPVVYLTADSNRELVDPAMETAPYGYILKPFNIREIKVVIKSAIRRHALDRQVKHRNQLLEAILTCLSNAVIAADAGGKVIYLNKEAQRLTGFSSIAALSSPLERVLYLTAEPGGDQAAQSPSSHRTLVTRNNEHVGIELAHYPLRGTTGGTEGDVYTFRDLTGF